MLDQSHNHFCFYFYLPLLTFHQDDDYTEGNVFIPAIQRICQQCQKITSHTIRPSSSSTTTTTTTSSSSELNQKANQLLSVIRKKFNLPPPSFSTSTEQQYEDDSGKGQQRKQMESDEQIMMACDNNDHMVQSGVVIMETNERSNLRDVQMNVDNYDNYGDDDDDEDGPVIVPYEEVQACIDRSSNQAQNATLSKENGSDKMTTSTDMNMNTKTNDAKHTKEKYPFLYAATVATQSKEDILMTCARILDEQRDVTLVREAAAYLEEIEAYR